MFFHLPTIAYSAIDLANRRAAATGSVRYAQMTSGADYNGHTPGVSWNSYRGYWITEYFWGERVVLARGTLANCLQAARDYYARGAKGSAVSVSYPNKWYATDNHRPAESVMQFAAICAAMGFVWGNYYAKGDDGQPMHEAFWTPKHDAVVDAMSMSKWFPGLDGIACNLPDNCTAADWEAAKAAELAGRRVRA